MLIFKNSLKNIKKNTREVVDLLVDSENRSLLAVWVSCALAVIVIGIYLQLQSASFLGVADSRETIINFEYSVLIKRVHVIAGQAVAKGEILAELEQPDLDLKIQQVRAQLSKLKAEYSLKQEMNRLGSFSSNKSNDLQNSQMDPVSTEIQSYEEQLKSLVLRERNLYVFAETAGVVGSVNFKKGEMAAPYSPILTISPTSPTYIQGFIYESLQTKVKTGQKIKITALADSSRHIEGRVVSLGSRIVQLPPRMERTPNMPLWGREVTVELPVANPFLLGEKVQVQPGLRRIGFPAAVASESEQKPLSNLSLKPSPMAVPEKVLMKSAFEPSGALYLKDLKKYLVISDDTDKMDSPFLFLLNSDGSVDSNVIQLENIDRIQDIESISQDQNGDIYLLSSQSLSSKKKLKKDREMILKIQQQGLRFKVVQSLSIRPMILEAIKKSKISEISELYSEATKKLEIEASYIDQGQLFVGLKEPMSEQGQNLIVNLGAIKNIFSLNKIETLEVAFEISFPGFGQEQTRISDVILVGSQLVISTISKKPGTMGRIWSLVKGQSQPRLISEFPSLSPEGLAYNSDTKELMVVFDEGSDTPLFVKIPLTWVK